MADVDECQRKQRDAIADLRFNDITYWHSRHRLRMAETCRNRYVYEFCERTHNQVRRLVCLQYRVEMRQPDFPKWQIDLLVQAHADILEVLKSGDRPRLIEMMADHVKIFEKRVANAITARQPDVPELNFS